MTEKDSSEVQRAVIDDDELKKDEITEQVVNNNNRESQNAVTTAEAFDTDTVIAEHFNNGNESQNKSMTAEGFDKDAVIVKQLSSCSESQNMASDAEGFENGEVTTELLLSTGGSESQNTAIDDVGFSNDVVIAEQLNDSREPHYAASDDNFDEDEVGKEQSDVSKLQYAVIDNDGLDKVVITAEKFKNTDCIESQNTAIDEDSFDKDQGIAGQLADSDMEHDGDSDDDLADDSVKGVLEYTVISKNAKDSPTCRLVQVTDKNFIKGPHVIPVSAETVWVQKKQKVKVKKEKEENDQSLITLGMPNHVETDTDTKSVLAVGQEINIFKCHACNEIFCTEAELTDHTVTHLDSNLCTGCGRAFASARAVLIHHAYCTQVAARLAKEKKGVFACKFCDKMFNYKSTVKNHIRTYHGEKSFVCCLCQKGFPTQRDLQRHSYTHSTKKPFICDKPNCKKGFTCKSSFNKHLRLKHQRAQIFKCSVCNKTFEMECDIKRHLYTHTNVRPFKCTFCSKSYTCKSSLRQHVSLVHENKKLTCLFCSKMFHTKQDLERHMGTHTGAKPWHCSVCKKSYTCKSALAAHKRNIHDISAVSDSEKKEGSERFESKQHDNSMDTDDDFTKSPLEDNDIESGISDSGLSESKGRYKGKKILKKVITLHVNEDKEIKEKRTKSKKPRKTKVKKS